MESGPQVTPDVDGCYPRFHDWLGDSSHPRRHEKRNSESKVYLLASNPFCEGGFEFAGHSYFPGRGRRTGPREQTSHVVEWHYHTTHRVAKGNWLPDATTGRQRHDQYHCKAHCSLGDTASQVFISIGDSRSMVSHLRSKRWKFPTTGIEKRGHDSSEPGLSGS